jgi:hypothetical protein
MDCTPRPPSAAEFTMRPMGEPAWVEVRDGVVGGVKTPSVAPLEPVT